MKNTVLDSYAVLAFLFGEKGADMVAGLFEEAAAETDHPLIICAPTWTEVRYISERKVGSKQWNQARSNSSAFPSK